MQAAAPARTTKRTDHIMNLPNRYKISEGQVANPNFGKAGHPDADKPAIAKPAKGAKTEEQPQPPTT